MEDSKVFGLTDALQRSPKVSFGGGCIDRSISLSRNSVSLSNSDLLLHESTPEILECSNCLTKNSKLWRKFSTGETLCNGCGLYYKLHGVVKPKPELNLKRKLNSPPILKSMSKRPKPDSLFDHTKYTKYKQKQLSSKRKVKQVKCDIPDLTPTTSASSTTSTASTESTESNTSFNSMIDKILINLDEPHKSFYETNNDNLQFETKDEYAWLKMDL